MEEGSGAKNLTSTSNYPLSKIKSMQEYPIMKFLPNKSSPWAINNIAGGSRNYSILTSNRIKWL